jgi:integrase
MGDFDNLVRLERRARRVETYRGPTGPSLEDLAPVDEFTLLVDKARAFKNEKHAPRTRKIYAREWKGFAAWATAKGLDVLPAHPATVALYVTELATTPWRDRHGHMKHARGRSPSGIAVAVAAIAAEHVMAGKQPPTVHTDVRGVIEGIRRKWADMPEIAEGPSAAPCAYCGKVIGNKPFYGFSEALAHVACHDALPPPQRAPILAHHVVAMANAQPNRRIGIRNRALLLVHWGAALRRSELSALTVEKIEFCKEGLKIRVGKTKNNQAGKPLPPKVLLYEADEAVCPVRALEAWLKEASIKTGFIFLHVDRWGHLHQRLTGHGIAQIIKKWAPAAGLDPKRVSGHSPRSGFVTSAAKAGKLIHKMMAQSQHVDVSSLMHYVQDEAVWEDAAIEGLLSRKASA